MAQELRIDTWCDVCLADGQHEPGEPVEVSLGGRPRVLDLCERDRKTYLDPLAELLENLGRKPGAPTTPAPTRRRRERTPATEQASGPVLLEVGPEDYPFRCPLCERPEPTGSALGAHMKTTHGTPMAAYYGNTCAVCGVEVNGSSGLGMHLNKTHGLAGGVAVAYEWARANGDPAGVVAERLKVAPR